MSQVVHRYKNCFCCAFCKIFHDSCSLGMAFKPNPVQQAIKDDFSRIHVFFIFGLLCLLTREKLRHSWRSEDCVCALPLLVQEASVTAGCRGRRVALWKEASASWPCSNSGGIVGRIYVIIFTEFTLEPSLACQRLRKSAVGCVNIAPAASSEGAVQPLHRTSVSSSRRRVIKRILYLA